MTRFAPTPTVGRTAVRNKRKRTGRNKKKDLMANYGTPTNAKCTDGEFIKLFREFQSPIKVARALEISERNVQARKLRIESRYGIILPINDNRAAYNTTRIINHKARINLTLSDAVLPVAGDVHVSPDKRTTIQRAFIETVRELKPKHVILVGDVFDGSRISRHPRIGFLENRPSVKDEIK